MAFTRDHGSCCLFLPLKLGCGIIAMLLCMHSVLCILALFTGDVRFQPNGYNQLVFRLPAVVGIFGIIFGFMGLLAIYDDNLFWMRAFRNFLFFKFIISVIAILADYHTLRQCDNWLTTPALMAQHNIAMQELAQEGLCPWARFSYAIGATADLLFWAYCCFQVWAYLAQLELNPPYPIDFGNERWDKDSRWRFYQVKDPNRGAHAALVQGKHVEEGYGTTQEEEPLLETIDTRMQQEVNYIYGPNGMPQGDGGDIYGPDGMPVQSMAFAPGR